MGMEMVAFPARPEIVAVAEDVLMAAQRRERARTKYSNAMVTWLGLVIFVIGIGVVGGYHMLRDNSLQPITEAAPSRDSDGSAFSAMGVDPEKAGLSPEAAAAIEAAHRAAVEAAAAEDAAPADEPAAGADVPAAPVEEPAAPADADVPANG